MTLFDKSALATSIRRHEGFSATVYDDHLGFATIGYGRLVDPRKAGAGISKEEGAMLLDNDIARVVAEVQTTLPWVVGLDDARQRVLYEMAFQMGTSGLTGFRNTLKAVEAYDWAKAYEGMLDSLWARQTPRRANTLANMMRDGK